MLRSAKQNFLKNLSTNLRSPKQFWSAYHSLSTNYQHVPRLLTNGSHTVESPSAKANMLNSYFTSNFSTGSNLPSTTPSPTAIPTLSEISCSNAEFYQLLKSFRSRWYIKQNALRLCLHYLFVPIHPIQPIPLYRHCSHCLENV